MKSVAPMTARHSFGRSFDGGTRRAALRRPWPARPPCVANESPRSPMNVAAAPTAYWLASPLARRGPRAPPWQRPERPGGFIAREQ